MDMQIHSVIIQLPNRQLISRAINHLFLLEIQATQPDDNKSEVTSNESVTSDLNGDSRPLRKAADQAHKKISEQLNDQAVVVVFSFPREYHGAEMECHGTNGKLD